VQTLGSLVDDEFVIYDDLGSTGLNDWRKEVLFEFLDQRYVSMKPTIVTSNLTREEIYQQIHPRVASRLFAKENTLIEVRDDDKRQS